MESKGPRVFFVNFRHARNFRSASVLALIFFFLSEQLRNTLASAVFFFNPRLVEKRKGS